jgi:helix-turn-helix protein
MNRQDHEGIRRTTPEPPSQMHTARILAVSPETLVRMRRSGKGPAFVRIRSCVRYSPDAIQRFLESAERGVEEPNA